MSMQDFVPRQDISAFNDTIQKAKDQLMAVLDHLFYHALWMKHESRIQRLNNVKDALDSLEQAIYR